MGEGVDGDQGLITGPDTRWKQPPPATRKPVGRRLTGFLWRHPRAQLGLLLSGPIGWLVVAYLGSLAVLFVASLWQLDDFSGEIVHKTGFQNFQELAETPVYRSIVQRTVLIAAAVTVTDALLAFPIAFYMAKVATPRVRALLVVAVLMPLWSSYLVKVYSWRIMLRGVGDRELGARAVRAAAGRASGTWPPGSSSPTSGCRSWCCRSTPGWSGSRTRCWTRPGDLGGRPWLTFRRVVLPLALPAVVAGSIFTFSLTLGDYITPTLVSSTQFIGNVVYSQRRDRQQPAAGRRVRHGAGGDHDRLPPDRPAAGRVRVALMHLSNGTRWLLRIGTGITLAFIYIPLIVIAHLRLQRVALAELADRRADARVVLARRSTTRGCGTRSGPRSRPGSGPRRSRWCWARSPRSPCRATASSGGRRSRSS